MSAGIIAIGGVFSMLSSICSASSFYACTDGTFDPANFSADTCTAFFSSNCYNIDTQEKCDDKDACQWDIFGDPQTCIRVKDSLSSSSEPGQDESEEYKYDFIINVKSQHTDGNDNYGMHITDIRIDGERATDSQIEVVVEPNHTKCNSKTDGEVSGYECEDGVYGMNDNEPSDPEYIDLTFSGWKEEDLDVGTKFMTITTNKKVSSFEIDYFRPKYAPGLIIKENGTEVVKETENGGSDGEPTPKTITYTIP
jgi:hypothetical protein